MYLFSQVQLLLLFAIIIVKEITEFNFKHEGREEV